MKSDQLARILKKAGLSIEALPSDLQKWQALVQQVDRAMCEDERLLKMSDQSLQLSQKEMTDLMQKQKEAAAQTVEEHRSNLETVLEAVPCWILYTDENGNHLGSNRAYWQFVHDFESALTPSASQGVSQEVRNLIERQLRQEESNEVDDLEVELDGKITHWRLVSRRSFKGVVLIGLDVTADHLARQEIENERMKSSNASRLAVLGEMAAGVAHEINNPLASMMGTTELIDRAIRRDNIKPDELSKRVAQIQKMIERISRIVKGLRTFARDGEHDEFLPVKAADVLQETLDLCRERISLRGIDLTVTEVPADWILECRATQIGQVLLNLINNAIDAIAGSETKWIRIEVTQVDELILGSNSEVGKPSGIKQWINFKILDSGPGIPPEIREKILNPFFTTKPVGQGTGLGLSISKGIAEAHGGSLRLDDATSTTCFVLKLPSKQNV